MQNRKRDTDVQNRLLDSVGEGEGGMWTALKQVYYQGWNRSPAQVGCMRLVLKEYFLDFKFTTLDIQVPSDFEERL